MGGLHALCRDSAGTARLSRRATHGSQHRCASLKPERSKSSSILDAVPGQLQLASVGPLRVVTDVPEYPYRDRVFPVFDDEALVLSDLALDVIETLRPACILDLGTGSGIIALRLASHAGSVAAVDINPRCVRFAQTNARANAIENVRVWTGDMFQPFEGSRFALVVSNPPFLPVPQGVPFHIAGNGGIDGTTFIRRMLAGVPRFLSADGCLLFTAISLSRGGRPLVLDLVSQALGAETVVSSADLYRDQLPLQKFHPLFSGRPGYEEWLTTLRARGFDALRYMVIRLTTRQLPPLAPRALTSTALSGGWAQRLRRYHLWLDTP